jgi:ribosomal-protein-serine acetyltransferase
VGDQTVSELPDLGAAGLRLLEPEDAPELYAVIDANREHLSPWVPWAAGQTLLDTEAFIASTREQHAANNGFQAAVAPGGAIVGIVGFHSVSWENRMTSLGYWLAADAQGRGTMTSAVRFLVDHAFGPWELHRVEIHAAPENLRSRAIPERLGFRQEAVLRETERIGDRYLDGVVYGVLEDEWRAHQSTFS